MALLYIIVYHTVHILDGFSTFEIVKC